MIHSESHPDKLNGKIDLNNTPLVAAAAIISNESREAFNSAKMCADMYLTEEHDILRELLLEGDQASHSQPIYIPEFAAVEAPLSPRSSSFALEVSLPSGTLKYRNIRDRVIQDCEFSEMFLPESGTTDSEIMARIRSKSFSRHNDTGHVAGEGIALLRSYGSWISAQDVLPYTKVAPIDSIPDLALHGPFYQQDKLHDSTFSSSLVGVEWTAVHTSPVPIPHYAKVLWNSNSERTIISPPKILFADVHGIASQHYREYLKGDFVNKVDLTKQEPYGCNTSSSHLHPSTILHAATSTHTDTPFFLMSPPSLGSHRFGKSRSNICINQAESSAASNALTSTSAEHNAKYALADADGRSSDMLSKSQLQCSYSGCTNLRRSGGLCNRHSGKLCASTGCCKAALSRGKCPEHGGGSRCKRDGCTKFAQTRGLCKFHGGGRQCHVAGCYKNAHQNRLCRSHGGGKRCNACGCLKWAQRSGYCCAHTKLGLDKRTTNLQRHVADPSLAAVRLMSSLSNFFADDLSEKQGQYVDP